MSKGAETCLVGTDFPAALLRLSFKPFALNPAVSVPSLLCLPILRSSGKDTKALLPQLKVPGYGQRGTL